MNVKVITMPEWIRKGAYVLIHSAVFGLIKVLITEVNHIKVTYEAELHNRNYDCAISYNNVLLMVESGDIKPC